MKLDPATGTIIWKTLVVGDSSWTVLNQPTAWKVEALHGTNDVIVGVTTHGASGSSTVCRVDSTGSQKWFVRAFLGSANASPGQRFFDSGPTGITVCQLLSGSPGSYTAPANIAGLDLTGATSWQRLTTGGSPIPNFSSASNNLSIRNYGSNTIVGTHVSSTTALVTRSIDTTTGADIWAVANAGNSGFTDVLCVDSNGDFADNTFSATFPSKRAATTGTVISTLSAGSTVNFGRFGPGGYLLYNFGLGTLYAKTIGLGTTFTLASTGTSPIKGSTLYDGCSNNTYGGSYYGPSNYYAVGTPSSQTHNYNIFALSNSGSLVWGIHNVDVPTGNNIMSGCCMSDDGYLYVSGQAVFG